MNLIPESVLYARERKRRALRWTVAVAASSVLAAAPLMMDWTRSARAAGLREESDRLFQELEVARTKLRAATSESTSTYLEIERANALRSKRSWSGIFALIASCMPDDCWLASVATDPETPLASARPMEAPAPSTPDAVKKTVAIEAPRKLRLVGFANSDTQPLAFVTRLKESGVFQGVLLERSLRAPDASSDQADQTVYQFEIVCEW